MANDNHSEHEQRGVEIERWLVHATWKETVDGKIIWRSGSWTESRGDVATIERILGAKK